LIVHFIREQNFHHNNFKTESNLFSILLFDKEIVIEKIVDTIIDFFYSNEWISCCLWVEKAWSIEFNFRDIFGIELKKFPSQSIMKAWEVFWMSFSDELFRMNRTDIYFINGIHDILKTSFSSFRSLKCARITLHMNLFASFAVNNCLWLIWYRVVLDPIVLNGDQVCTEKHKKLKWSIKQWSNFIINFNRSSDFIFFYRILNWLSIEINTIWILNEKSFFNAQLLAIIFQFNNRQLFEWKIQC
jgi:hypothetical protein